MSVFGCSLSVHLYWSCDQCEIKIVWYCVAAWAMTSIISATTPRPITPLLHHLEYVFKEIVRSSDTVSSVIVLPLFAS